MATKKTLIKAAKDINKNVNPEPNIDTGETGETIKKATLENNIKKVAEQVIKPEMEDGNVSADDLTEETHSLLDEYEVNPFPVEGEEEEQEEEGEEEEGEEGEEEEQKEESDADEGGKKSASKGSGKKQEKKEKSGKSEKQEKKEKGEKPNMQTPAKNKTGKGATKLVEEMIAEGKYTRKEILDALEEKGYKRSTPSTIISDAMSEKYQKFDKLAVKDEDGVLTFAE